MANIEHSDQIWTVPQFNSYCETNNIPMKIEPTEATGSYSAYKQEAYQVIEEGRVHVPFAQGEAYAVIYAADRLKEKWSKAGKYTVDWNE